MAEGMDPLSVEEQRKQIADRLFQEEVAEADQQQQFRQRAWDMTQPPPDQAAEALGLGTKFGVPRQAVEADPDYWRKRDEAARRKLMQETSPQTLAWLDSEDNYAVAKDDTDILSQIESTFSKIGYAAKGGAQRFAASGVAFERQAAGETMDYYRRLDEWEQREERRKQLGQEAPQGWRTIRTPDLGTISGFDLPIGYGNLDAAPGASGIVREQVRKTLPASMRPLLLSQVDRSDAKAVRPVLERKMAEVDARARATVEEFTDSLDKARSDNFVLNGLTQAVTSVTEMAPSLVTFMALRGRGGATLASGAMGGQVFAGEYLEGIYNLNLDERAASDRALLQAGVEVVTERISLSVLDDIMKSDKGFLTKFATGMAAEQIQEQAATLGNRLIDVPYTDPDMTAGEFLAATPKAAANTAITTLFAAGFTNATMLTIDHVARRMVGDAINSTESAGDRAIKTLLDKAQSAKTMKRAPAKFAEYVDGLAAKSNLETVVVDLDGLVDALNQSGIDPTETLTALGVTQEELAQKYERFGEIEVKTSALVSSPAMAMHRAALEPHMRAPQDAATPAKKEKLRAEMDAAVKENVALVQDAIEAGRTTAEKVAEVRDRVRQQIRGTGIVADGRQLEAQTEIYSSMITTMALRTGADPMEFFKERAPRLKGEVAGEVMEEGALEQDAYHGTDAVFDAFDTSFIGSADGKQKFGRGFYFTDNKDVASAYITSKGRVITADIPEDRELLDWDAPISSQDISLRDILYAMDDGSIAALVEELNNSEDIPYGVDPEAQIEAFLMGENVLDDIKDYATPEQVKRLRDMQQFDSPADDLTGGNVYTILSSALGSAEAANTLLRELGIKGTRSEDMTLKQGDKNYVVFDPADIKMKRDDDSLSQLIGPRAKGANKAILNTAKKMAKEKVRGADGKKKAKYTRQQIWDETAKLGQPWYQDKNGDWISEIEDGSIVVKDGKGPLGEVIEMPSLYAEYPELKKMTADTRSRVTVQEDTGRADVPGTKGVFTLRPFLFGVNVRISDRGPISREYTVTHELQHAVDHLENREMGRNKPYLFKDSERRAFNTMYRRLWTMEERIATPPWKTEQEAIDWMMGQRDVNAPAAVYGKDGTYDPGPTMKRPDPPKPKIPEADRNVVPREPVLIDMMGRTFLNVKDMLRSAKNNPAIMAVIEDASLDIAAMRDAIVKEVESIFAAYDADETGQWRNERLREERVGLMRQRDALEPWKPEEMVRHNKLTRQIEELDGRITDGDGEFDRWNDAVESEDYELIGQNLGSNEIAEIIATAESREAAIEELVQRALLDRDAREVFRGRSGGISIARTRAEEAKQVAQVQQGLDAMLVDLDAPFSAQRPEHQKAIRALWDAEAERLDAPEEYSVDWDNPYWLSSRGLTTDQMSLRQLLTELAQTMMMEDGTYYSGKELIRNLRAAGIVGGRYVPGGLNTDEDAAPQIPSILIMDERAPDVVRDRDTGNLLQERRGQYAPKSNTVTLFEQADVTTLMHEGAHWYLTMIEEMAAQEGAHPFVVEQYEAIKAWYEAGKAKGTWAHIRARYSIVEEGGRFSVLYNGERLNTGLASREEAEAKIDWREMQEAFAETFETYLQNGKAPSSELREAFRAFKAWITQLWKRMYGGGQPARANLTPDIVAVMDRMLAVEEEMDAQVAGIASNAQAQAKALLDRGIITQRQYDKALETLDEAREKAKEDLMARLMDAKMREDEAWWAVERKRVKGDVVREFDRSPVGRALAWLGYGIHKGDVPVEEAPGDRGEVEFYQSIRTAARMPMQDVDAWVRANITADESTFSNGDTLTVVRFPLTDDPDAPEVMLSIRMKADGKQAGRAEVNLFLNSQMADAMDNVEDVAQRGRMAMEMFGKALLVMRKYAVEYDPKAFSFTAAESQAEGTKAKSREALYRFMLSNMKMDNYTAYEVESQTSLVNEVDGVKSANPMFPSAGFMLVKDGENVEAFARNEIIRGNQRGGGAGEVVTALKATRLTPDFDASGRRVDRRGPRAGAADSGGAVGDTLGQEVVSPPQYKPVEDAASVDGSFAYARNQLFATNRDLKVGLQQRVRDAADENDVDLSDEDYLVRMTERDARSALIGNANAVGWYDEKVRKAITALTLLHPEMETDAEARFAFTWALAVTSNGLKVDKNFELAETVYSSWKASAEAGGDRRMPTNVGIGTAAKAINKSLGLYNNLVEKHGVQVVLNFMTARQTVKQVQAFTGENVSGENLTTEVFGAAALGPKIGNGFFMNLYGEFGQLTMDRWLMRTWGRWSATLIEDNRKQVRESRNKLAALLKLLSAEDKRTLATIIGRPIKLREIDEVGLALQRASMKPALREQMNMLGWLDGAESDALTEVLGPAPKGATRDSVGAEIRKRGNALAKYLDGQKEQPSGPPERKKIRTVFARALENLKNDFPTLTMADLQALLWYPEKRLYDTAKAKEGEENEGYEDDEAPDYANAARNLVVSKGVAEASVRDAYARIDVDVQAARRATGMERGGAGRGRDGGTAGQDGGAEDTLGQEVAPTFYSALGRFISSSATTKAPAAQWKGMIQNAPGVKAEEVEWTGVLDWLDASEGVVTREALAEFVEANGVRVEEVVRGAPLGGNNVRLEEIQREMLPLIEERDRIRVRQQELASKIDNQTINDEEKREYKANSNRFVEIGDLLVPLQQEEYNLSAPSGADTKWSSWTLPGGSNYREMLLRLPDDSAQKMKAYVEYRDALYERYGKAFYQTEASEQELRKLAELSEATGKVDPQFRSSHWSEPNVLAHVRFKERTGPNGERVLALEEIQSDWGQTGREQGFVDPQAVAAAKEAGENAAADRALAFEDMKAALLLDDVRELVNASGTQRERETIASIAANDFSRNPMSIDLIRNAVSAHMRNPRLSEQSRAALQGGYDNYRKATEAFDEAQRLRSASSRGVPDGPFVKNTSSWANLVLKRMIRFAAENGFDAVAWIPGSVQNGRDVSGASDNRGDFYDKIVPNLANKLGKKYGARVERIEMPAAFPGSADNFYDTYDFRPTADGWMVQDRRGDMVGEEFYPTEAEAIASVRGRKDQSFHSLPITPELAAAAMTEGFPLFQPGDPRGWGETAPPPDLPPMRLDLAATEQLYGKAAVDALPRAVKNRSRDRSSLDSMLDAARASAKTLKRKPPKTLLQFIRSRKARTVEGKTVPVKQWGIRGAADELKAMDRPDLINETNGIHIDYMREAAQQAGYIGEDATVNDFLDAIAAEAKGNPVYSEYDRAEVQDRENAQSWADFLDEQGVDIFEPDQKKLKAAIAKVVQSTGADLVTPDQAAERLGFETGEQLLAALAAAGSREKFVEAETDRRMRQEWGDPFASGEFAEAARQAAESEVKLMAAEIEIEALARALGETAASKLAKEMAMDALSVMTVKELAGWPRFLDIERRETRNAMEAVRKGDIQKALIHKRRQLVNGQLAKAAREKSEALEKTRKDLMSYLTSKPRRDKIARDYLDKIEALLDQYELRVSKQAPGVQRKRLSAKQYVDQMTADGRESEIAPEALLLAEMADAKVWRTLTVDEAEYLAGTVRNLAHLGRTKNKLLRAAEKRRFDAVVGELVDALIASPSARKRGKSFSPGIVEEQTSRLSVFDAKLTAIPDEFEWLDGKQGGALATTLGLPFEQADVRKLTMLREATRKVRDIWKAMPADLRKATLSRRVATPELPLPTNQNMTLMDVVIIGLNYGNEGNRKALMDGYGWEAPAIEAVLDRYLTDQHWQMIDGIWSLIGSYKAEAFALEKRLTGVEPKAVEGITFTLPSGRVVKGQYFPLKYDADQESALSVKQGKLDEKQTLSEMGMSFSKPMTKTGHLIERTGSGGKPVKMSIDVFYEHIENVIHDIAFRPAVIDTFKIIRDPRFTQAYIDAAGKAQYDRLMPWLHAIATNNRSRFSSTFARTMTFFRGGWSISMMGYSFSTATQQLTGYIDAATEIGPRWVLQGAMKSLSLGPASFWREWAFIRDRSEYLANRVTFGKERDIRAVRTNPRPGGTLAPIGDNAFVFLSTMDAIVGTGVWRGAYDKAMTGRVNGIAAQDEEQAIAFADRAVQRSLSSGEVYRLPEIMREGEISALMTMVYSFGSKSYNRQRSRNLRLRYGKIDPATFTVSTLIAFMAVPILAALLAGRLWPDDDEDWEERADDMANEVLMNAAGTTPFARDMVSLLARPQYGYQLSPVQSTFEQIGVAARSAAEGKTFDSEYQAKQAVMAVATVFRLPGSQLFETGDYMYDLYMGDEDPMADPADAAREALIRSER